MPLQMPNLDDRRYADLVAEARALIPTHAPEWTNHNPSDPGITLIELFAYLSEMLIYRLNRVTAQNVLSFLKLLNGTNWDPFSDDVEEKPPFTKDEKTAIALKLQQLSPEELGRLITEQLPKAILKLRRLDRAVSRQDFEVLAKEADSRVVRARCLPRRDISLGFELEREGHVSLMVLPKKDENAHLAEILGNIKKYIAPRLLVSTRLHVVGPIYAEIGITVKVVPMPDVKEADARDAVKIELRNFFTEFPDETKADFFGQHLKDGWPFGRNVFVSEIFAVLDRLRSVDYVVSATLASPEASREIKNNDQELIGMEVRPYELVKVIQLEINGVKMQ